MAKGKYKRKKQQPKQQAYPAHNTVPGVEKKEMAENKTESATQSPHKSTNQENPRWGHFIEWAKRESTFTDWCIAAFTCGLFVASIYQFIILNGQLDVMRKDQRAWITLEEAGRQLNVGQPIAFRFFLHNTGKTPARDLDATFRMEILDVGGQPTFTYPDKFITYIHTNAQFPNDRTTLGITSLIPVPGTETIQPTMFTQDLGDKWNNRQIWFAVYGVITYIDIFGKTHWDRKCEVFFNVRSDVVASTPGGARKCVQYNDFDRN